MRLKSKTLYSFALLILLVMTVFLLVQYRNKLVAAYDKHYAILKNESILINDILRSCLTNSNRNIGLVMSDTLELIDSHNNTVLLGDIVAGSPKLIYRIADSHCSSCVKSGLESLQKWSSEFNKKDVLVIGSFNNDTDFNRFMEKEESPFRVFRVKQSINLQVEELGFPYFLVVDERIKVQSCFIPSSSLPGYNDDFFMGIQHLL